MSPALFSGDLRALHDTRTQAEVSTGGTICWVVAWPSQKLGGGWWQLGGGGGCWVLGGGSWVVACITPVAGCIISYY